MEPVKATLTYWPQALVGFFMIIALIWGYMNNGKPMEDPIISFKQLSWNILWFALVLGMGGFWNVH